MTAFIKTKIHPAIVHHRITLTLVLLSIVIGFGSIGGTIAPDVQDSCLGDWCFKGHPSSLLLPHTSVFEASDRVRTFSHISLIASLSQRFFEAKQRYFGRSGLGDDHVLVQVVFGIDESIIHSWAGQNQADPRNVGRPVWLLDDGTSLHSIFSCMLEICSSSESGNSRFGQSLAIRNPTVSLQVETNNECPITQTD